MPGPGRSKGCYRCRSKKVRCDQTQPNCNRCQNLGVKCPGYRPENELVFCNMNGIIEEGIFSLAPKRSRRKATEGKSKVLSQPRDPTIHEKLPRLDNKVEKSEEQPESWAVVKHVRAVPIRNQLSTDWDEQALCRFFADYVIETDDLQSSPGFLDKLPCLHRKVKHSDNVLAHAVSAVSLANYGNQVHSEGILIRARNSYGRGLAALHAYLSEGTLASDEVLAGVVMLNMYEMFSGDKPPQKSIWETHGDALGMLLRARGTSDQFVSGDSAGISRAAYRVIMFKNLLRRTAPGLESTLWEESADPTTPWNLVYLACNRISRLLPLADAILAEDSSNMQSQRLMEIVGMMRAEDSNYQLWSAMNSETHLPVTEMVNAGEQLPTPPADNPNGMSWLVHQARNVYRAARIILLQTLLNLAIRAVLHEDLLDVAFLMQNLRIQTSKYISETVDEISSSTALVLAELEGKGWTERNSQDGKTVAGYTSIFPLKVALSVKTLSVEQRMYIEAQLMFIECTLGLGQARTIRAAASSGGCKISVPKNLTYSLQE